MHEIRQEISLLPFRVYFSCIKGWRSVRTGFLTSAVLILGLRWLFVKKAVLYMVFGSVPGLYPRCLQHTLPAPPSCDDQKCLQTLANVPMSPGGRGAKGNLGWEPLATSMFYIHQIFIENTSLGRLCARRWTEEITSCLHGASVYWGTGVFRLVGDMRTGAMRILWTCYSGNISALDGPCPLISDEFWPVALQWSRGNAHSHLGIESVVTYSQMDGEMKSEYKMGSEQNEMLMLSSRLSLGWCFGHVSPSQPP